MNRFEQIARFATIQFSWVTRFAATAETEVKERTMAEYRIGNTENRQTILCQLRRTTQAHAAR